MIDNVVTLGKELSDGLNLKGYNSIVIDLIDEFISVKLPLIKNKKKRKDTVEEIEKIMEKISEECTSPYRLAKTSINPHTMDEKEIYVINKDIGHNSYSFYQVVNNGMGRINGVRFQIIANRSKRFKPDIDWSTSKQNSDYSINEMEYFLNKNSIKYGGYKNIYAVKYFYTKGYTAEQNEAVERDFVKALNKVGIFPEVFIKVPESSLSNPMGLRKLNIRRPEVRTLPLKVGDNFTIFRTPEETYQNVIDKIKDCCESEKYDYIAMTIYRLKAPYINSEIYKALKKAIERGADVRLHIETLARGNERENIALYKEFSAYRNCTITTTYMGYKVHAKFFVAIASKESESFAHISTGNYNEKNAETYADTQVFTDNTKVADTLSHLMYSIQNKVPAILDDETYVISPLMIRSKILSLILQETEKGEEGRVYIKCNSLCDPIIIRQLYRAAMCGVKIMIICRGACSIYKFKNIKIKRILGYNLEHERFYIFGDDAYISSADLLIRNMDRRIEMFYNVSNVKDTMLDYFTHDWDPTTDTGTTIQYKINRKSRKKNK